MQNIISYVQERGASSFDGRPFGEVDSLVLSQLAYFNFSGFDLEGNDFSLTLAELAARGDSDRLYEGTRSQLENSELLRAAADSRRFGELRLGLYENVFDEEREVQFSAIGFKLGRDLYYLAFRGTDATLVGWKEDLNMAFMTAVPSQVKAVEYTREANRRLEGARLILGGHSKGGNLAEYAAVNSAQEVQRSIIGVYNHDGPGFKDDALDEQGLQKMRQLIHKTVPQSSVVGMLLQQQGEYKTIKSNAISILAHDPFTWEVQGDSFVNSEGLTGFSVYTNRTINEWLCRVDMERREIFVDTLYDMLSSWEESDDSFKSGRFAKSKALIGALTSVDPEVRRVVFDTLAALMQAAGKEIHNTVSSIIHRDKDDEAEGKR